MVIFILIEIGTGYYMYWWYEIVAHIFAPTFSFLFLFRFWSFFSATSWKVYTTLEIFMTSSCIFIHEIFSGKVPWTTIQYINWESYTTMIVLWLNLWANQIYFYSHLKWPKTWLIRAQQTNKHQNIRQMRIFQVLLGILTYLTITSAMCFPFSFASLIFFHFFIKCASNVQ